jgi:lipopolysaccharide biosynthesis glycosyltransferase
MRKKIKYVYALYEMKDNLVYTLVNFKTKLHVNLVKVFLKSICLFSSNARNFDLLIITDRSTKPIIEALPEARALSVYMCIQYMEVPEDKDMFHALLRKFEITNYHGFYKYKKIMFLDCDIVVQGELSKLFAAMHLPNILYAPEEGTIEGRYWNLGAYRPGDVVRMKRSGIKSFNCGTFVFIPNSSMAGHLKAAYDFALKYTGKKYYDQSFWNYYFNVNNISSTLHISPLVKLSPDTRRYYPGKIVIHFTGIEHCEEKSVLMNDYLNRVVKHTKNRMK